MFHYNLQVVSVIVSKLRHSGPRHNFNAFVVKNLHVVSHCGLETLRDKSIEFYFLYKGCSDHVLKNLLGSLQNLMCRLF